MARDFRKVKAWERAHALTLQVYRAMSGFPWDRGRTGILPVFSRDRQDACPTA